MFIIKNPGQFPVIIRDLNLHIAGGKEVDLDSLFSRDTVERSVNLDRLINANKIVIVGQEKAEKKQQRIVRQKPKENNLDAAILLELRKDLLEVKDMLRAGAGERRNEENSEVSAETVERLNKLKVRNLSLEDYEVEKNFEKIGNTVEKEEGLSDLLDTLDSLESN